MKAHEGTLRYMERQALDRGEGELERTENPGSVQYYEKRAYGKSHRYYEVDPFAEFVLPDPDAVEGEPKTLDLTEWNKAREEFHKTDRNTGCNARVLCPSPSCKENGEVQMVYATEVILSNAGNMPAKRQVQCRQCGRTGTMLL
jgi:hypothetical protein